MTFKQDDEEKYQEDLPEETSKESILDLVGIGFLKTDHSAEDDSDSPGVLEDPMDVKDLDDPDDDELDWEEPEKNTQEEITPTPLLAQNAQLDLQSEMIDDPCLLYTSPSPRAS